LFRATGAAATFGMVLISIPVIFNPASALGIITAVKSLPIVYPVVKFLVSFPLVYHTIGGIRHLIWDFSSRGLETVEEVDISSRIVLFTAIIVSVLLSFIQF